MGLLGGSANVTLACVAKLANISSEEPTEINSS